MNRSAPEGFTLIELIMSMTLTCVVAAGVLGIASHARDAFTVQPEAADVQQRLRVTVSRLMKDLLMAGAGRRAENPCHDEMGAPVLPYRAGALASDSAAGTYYRPGVVSVAYAEFSPAGNVAGLVRRTYYLKATPPDGFQLMQYDGLETDHPVLENVVSLAFEYLGVAPPDPPSGNADPMPLDPSIFVDGPWCPGDVHADRFDADLLRIRRVRVAVRVQAPGPFRGPAGVLFAHAGRGRSAVLAPDQAIRFDVAPRSLNLNR